MDTFSTSVNIWNSFSTTCKIFILLKWNYILVILTQNNSLILVMWGTQNSFWVLSNPFHLSRTWTKYYIILCHQDELNLLLVDAVRVLVFQHSVVSGVLWISLFLVHLSCRLSLFLVDLSILSTLLHSIHPPTYFNVSLSCKLKKKIFAMLICFPSIVLLFSNFSANSPNFLKSTSS